jgi:quinone-modifying oxidoreductase subunit QmoC
MPLSVLVALVFLFGIIKMLSDMKADYFRRGLSNGAAIRPIDFIKTLVTTLPEIIDHRSFASCDQNQSRKRNHMLVSISFVNLALVAGAFVFALYILNSHGPYSQLNPVKIFANLSGIALILGSCLMIRDRLKDSSGSSSYFDWHLPGLVLILGVTGMLSQFVRLADWPGMAVTIYFIHLIAAFNLIAFLPYTKIAHFVYRTIALAYRNYAMSQEGAAPDQ